jgi:hypothetical protein
MAGGPGRGLAPTLGSMYHMTAGYVVIFLYVTYGAGLTYFERGLNQPRMCGLIWL